MKTAMQELKEYLESKEYNYMNAALMEFALDINKNATELLEKEKQQIINAYCGGCKQGAKYGIKADDYFKETYE